MKDIETVTIQLLDPELDIRGHTVDWSVQLTATDFDGQSTQSTVELEAATIHELPDSIQNAILALIGRHYDLQDSDFLDFAEDMIETTVAVRETNRTESK